jgi:lipopolysaccharide transport system ATP-binding protein
LTVAPGPAAIRVTGVGKRYRLGERRARYKALRDVLAGAAAAPVRLLRRIAGGATPESERETIWALQDVSCEIAHGEVVGIIGRNGAGKSTLLKILARITDPTTGVVEIEGRIGSLLEVGTGFHPELTGAENIFLNGVILGMRKREIDGKFDEIVSFAGVEKFVDTPVKHYSSGMYLRLAFSVAAHLEPEIMLVDEVLAVGDAAFQRKCLDKMEEVGRKGRTVLFVSHNMPAITRLCPRTILLDGGRVVADGPSHEVVSAYLSTGAGTTSRRDWSGADAPGDSVVRLLSVSVTTEEGRVSDAIDIRRPVGLRMEYDVLEPGHVLYPTFEIFNDEGLRVFDTIDSDPEWRGRARTPGRFVSTAWIPGNFLSEGTLFVNAEIATYHPLTQHVLERDAVAFQVVDSLDGDSARGDWAGSMRGAVRPLLKWTTRAEAAAGRSVTAAAP